jgi:tryptophanyl-tRNA synthetase
MSKSTSAQGHAVRLLDEPAQIRRAIMRAVTDSGLEITFDPQRPGVMNLLTIYQALTNQTRPQIEAHFAGKGYGDLKKEVAEVVVAALEPLQERYRRITADPSYIDGLLKESVARLRPIVDDTMARVRVAMGIR